MTLRITDIEAVGERRRGLRRCPNCSEESLRLYETRGADVPALRGAVVCARRYECGTCGTLVRFLEVSVGVVTKRAERAWRDRDDETPSAEVRITDGRIVIIA